MPSEKRARQRAMREIKVAEQERTDKRNRRLKRIGGTVIIAGLIVGLIFLITSGSNKTTNASGATGASGSTGTSGASGAATTTSEAATSTTAAGLSSPNAKVPACPPATAGGATHRVTTFAEAPPVCISQTGTYVATVITDVGTFKITMPAEKSVAAVNNFVFLSRYHFYNGVSFHRVIPGFVVQGGDPTGTGTGGPGYSWTGNTPPSSCEGSNSCYPLGSVAVANSGDTSSNGSQFFVVVGPQGEQLPPNYTLFGQVTSGMNVVNKIAADGTSGGTPKVKHHMVSVTISQIP